VNLTEDQIISLAPDESSMKAGKDLANASKWVTKGANDQAIWGECQGSGSKPYQTQIDLTNIAFKCSCPSRKFPCKHGIGLGLLYSRQSKTFTQQQAPDWVTAWITRRADKEEKKTERKEKPVDEAAQNKRQLAREQKVVDGVEELLLWIKDIVRNGMINVPDKAPAYWEALSKRMVDAQAPGLSAMVKSLGETFFHQEGWQSEFLEKLLNLYLLAKAFQNKENLDELLQQDVRNWIGFTRSQEELKEQQGVSDTWLVLGKQLTEEDNLTIERNWLYGINSNEYALILQFLVGGQAATILLSPGMFIEAELVFYPSVSPMRALIKRQIAGSIQAPQKLFTSWQEIAELETMQCAQFPIRNERPYAIKELLPVNYNNSWWLRDVHNNMTMLKPTFSGIWKLLALGGGKPLHTALVGKENSYEPLGVWLNETYKAI
jgi:hypothetical protein